MDEAERRRNMRELAEEEYAETTPTRVEEVILDELYLCELETAEHGLRLGLGIATKKGPLNEDSRPTWTVAWFKVKSKNGWKTKNIAFEEYKQRGKRLTDDLEIASFWLHIDENDLTKVGREKKDTEPKFSGGFTDKVLAFARSEKLDEHDTEDEMDVVEDGDVEDGDGDEGEDEVLEDNLAWGAPEAPRGLEAGKPLHYKGLEGRRPGQASHGTPLGGANGIGLGAPKRVRPVDQQHQ